MSDYAQPEFYRFNEDSILLVNEIVKRAPRAMSVLDIGAGSGIIGLELARLLSIPTAHFLELQKEWAPYLEPNIRNFLPHAQTSVFWTSAGEWVPELKYDLIVSNPPYFLPGKARLSPDPVRGKCRMFLTDGWKVLLEKSLMALNRDGQAWFITPRDNLNYVLKVGGNLKLEVIERNELVLLRLSSG